MSPSRNILRYGPATGNGNDTSTVEDDGTIRLAGTGSHSGWDGLKWVQDVEAFPIGQSFQIGCDDLPDGIEMVVRFNDNTDNAHTFVYPARTSSKSGGVVPADAKTVFMALRRNNTNTDMTARHVKPMCNLGDTLLPFEKPDNTSWRGVSMS